MQILLKCRDAYGSVSFPAELLDGVLIPERHYVIANNTLILQGRSDYILHRDCDALLAMPDGLFRMLTPAEQDELSLAVQQAAMAQESVPADSAASQPAQEASLENAPVDPAPPALSDLSSTDQPKKKASGG